MARGRSHLLARFGSEPHAGTRPTSRCLRDRHPDRRARPGALGLPPFGQLSFSDDTWARGKVVDPEEKKLHLANFVNGLFPGAWSLLRTMTVQEAKATTVLSLPIDEASAKIRTGGPKDDDEDYTLPIWAGVVPLNIAVGEPQSDARNLPGIEPPAHAYRLRIG